MSPSIPPPGVFVPVPTFFHPPTSSASGSSASPGALDIETQIKHSIHLAKNGVKGLVLLGSTGEAIHLTRQERIDLVAGVRKGLEDAGIKDYPIMAGVLTNAVEEVGDWLTDYKEAGAQWGLVLVPGYFGPAVEQTEIVEWYTRVADRSPIPILIYHYPGVTNNITITVPTYATLAAHPNIVGAKMSHGNLSHHLQVSLHPSINHDEFRLYSGFGQQLFPLVICNGAGVIDGLAAIYPATVSTLFDNVIALRQGGEAAASGETLKLVQKLQWEVSTAEEFIGATGGIKGIKAAVTKVLGLGSPEGARLPLRAKLAEGEWEKWSDVWERMGALEAKYAKP